MVKRLFLLLCVTSTLVFADSANISPKVIADLHEIFNNGVRYQNREVVSETLLLLEKVNTPVDMSDALVATCQAINDAVAGKNADYLSHGVFAAGASVPWLIRASFPDLHWTKTGCFGVTCAMLCAAAVGFWSARADFHARIKKSNEILNLLFNSSVYKITDAKKVGRALLSVDAYLDKSVRELALPYVINVLMNK